MMQEYGRHAVSCEDVMKIEGLPNDEKADIFYSDPPWGQGNLKYWQTMNNKMNGLSNMVQLDLDAFINKIFSLAFNSSKGVVFLEYGIKWKDKVIEMGKRAGLFHIGIADTVYKGGDKFRPLNVHIFHKECIASLPDSYYQSLKGTHGIATLRAATKPFIVKDGIIFDPCCGLGLCAKLAVETGMRFRGNELNKARLQSTIKIISKDIGG